MEGKWSPERMPSTSVSRRSRLSECVAKAVDACDMYNGREDERYDGAGDDGAEDGGRDGRYGFSSLMARDSWKDDDIDVAREDLVSMLLRSGGVSCRRSAPKHRQLDK